MPTLRVSLESMSLLINEARRLKVSVKDVADNLIGENLPTAEEDESEEEESEEEEGEEGED